MYQRKTQDVYLLIWQGEEIDEAASHADAKYLKGEYNLAYGGGVTVRKSRRPIEPVSDAQAQALAGKCHV